MKMKVILLLAALTLTVNTGCSIFKAPTEASAADRIERIGAVAELAAYTGTALWLTEHPGDRAKFQAAADALAAATTGDLVVLQKVLASLPVKELKGEKGAIIIGAAILLYETELSRLTKIDQASAVAVVSAKVRAGITRALATVQ
jgi:RecA/RadA recombinase